MKVNWKFLWLAILVLPLAFLAGGCGGINAGTTVSPATFFMPGIMKNDSVPATNSFCLQPSNAPAVASAD